MASKIAPKPIPRGFGRRLGTTWRVFGRSGTSLGRLGRVLGRFLRKTVAVDRQNGGLGANLGAKVASKIAPKSIPRGFEKRLGATWRVFGCRGTSWGRLACVLGRFLCKTVAVDRQNGGLGAKLGAKLASKIEPKSIPRGVGRRLGATWRVFGRRGASRGRLGRVSGRYLGESVAVNRQNGGLDAEKHSNPTPTRGQPGGPGSDFWAQWGGGTRGRGTILTTRLQDPRRGRRIKWPPRVRCSRAYLYANLRESGALGPITPPWRGRSRSGAHLYVRIRESGALRPICYVKIHESGALGPI